MSDLLPAGGAIPDGTGGGSTRLKILVVSFRFPPYNSVGAISVSKTVKYLATFGHEVRVVTARDQQLPTTLPMVLDADSVVATSWVNPMRLVEAAAGGRELVAATGHSAGRRHDRPLYRVGRVYRSIMIPDRQIGWGPPAFVAGCRMTRDWRPDVIYASAPPYTSLLAAHALALRRRIPWVAGLRDLWSDNPYRSVRAGRLDRALEARVLSSATGIVVTTEESEELIRDRFHAPTTTVMNGYDPDDVRDRTCESRPDELRIVHTGVLVHDRRDPTPLFLAMRELRAEGRTIVADFYGRDSAIASKAADGVGVGTSVFAHGPISHGGSLKVQRDADVLLLLQSDNPRERRTCPAKIFEYAAARRPVLAIGPDGGVVARLMSEHGMGRVVRRPDEIAAELRRMMDTQARMGVLPDVAQRPPSDLSRLRQVEKLSDFLTRVADSPFTREKPQRC
jgi:hypothetical protein